MEEKTFYISKEKLKDLKKEHEDLVAVERNKVVGVEAPKILESEDMNPEFISYHEDMDSLRSRIDELQNILDNYEIIKNPAKEKQVFVDVGATVKLEVEGKKDQLMIVGTLEADPELGKISNESPVGKALVGHKVGDEITVSSPYKATYKIKNIKYEVS